MTTKADLEKLYPKRTWRTKEQFEIELLAPYNDPAVIKSIKEHIALDPLYPLRGTAHCPKCNLYIEFPYHKEPCGCPKPIVNHSSDLEDCIEDLRIISMNPLDKKLLKQELHDKYSEDTIKLARKILKGR